MGLCQALQQVGSPVFIVACRLLVAACGIYFPDLGIKPRSPALGAQSLSCWTAREVPLVVKPVKSESKSDLFCSLGQYLAHGWTQGGCFTLMDCTAWH